MAERKTRSRFARLLPSQRGRGSVVRGGWFNHTLRSSYPSACCIKRQAPGPAIDCSIHMLLFTPALTAPFVGNAQSGHLPAAPSPAPALTSPLSLARSAPCHPTHTCLFFVYTGRRPHPPRPCARSRIGGEGHTAASSTRGLGHTSLHHTRPPPPPPLAGGRPCAYS